MLYNLIETKRGKDIIIMTDQFKLVNKRKAALLQSHKGKKIDYKVVPAETNEKYARPLHDGSYREGRTFAPRRIK